MREWVERAKKCKEQKKVEAEPRSAELQRTPLHHTTPHHTALRVLTANIFCCRAWFPLARSHSRESDSTSPPESARESPESDGRAKAAGVGLGCGFGLDSYGQGRESSRGGGLGGTFEIAFCCAFRTILDVFKLTTRENSRGQKTI
jgi:hypothetical protein